LTCASCGAPGCFEPANARIRRCTGQNQAPEAVSVRIFIDLSDTSGASMRIKSPRDHRATTARVSIECVPCRFGGFRCYFLCPLERLRCEQLFLVEGIFASRQAHRLTYASQGEDELCRAKRKARKLCRQVNGDAPYVRPRGRKRSDLVERPEAAKDEAGLLYRERLRAMVGDIP
jgi:hypothetical protein